MTATASRPKMLSRFAGSLDPDLGLLVHENYVRASHVRLALHASNETAWKARLQRAGVTPSERAGFSRTLWITRADAQRLLDDGGTT
jgi:hypothetical protein